MRTAVTNGRRTRLAGLGVAIGLTLVVAGCGGSDDGSDDQDSDPTASSQPSGGAPSGFPGMDSEQMSQISECLEAAGLDSAMPSGRPSGMPTDMPSDFPSDFPSDMPSDFPSDMPSDFPTDMPGGGAGGAFSDPDVQAALEACGIELTMPSAPPS